MEDVTQQPQPDVDSDVITTTLVFARQLMAETDNYNKQSK